MPSFDDILAYYRKQIQLPWQNDVHYAGRVWMVWYDKGLERRIRGQLYEFEHLTKAAGHGWQHLDLVSQFPKWMATHEFLSELLDQPEELRSILPEFEAHLIEKLKSSLDQASDNDVIVVTGSGSLFGLVRVSTLITKIASAIRGRLVLTFPGSHQSNVYRLLDARDGWNYHAIPIPPADAV
ncbi:BREX protein BrxB domain-containing protein [Propionivibrio sp.]|uniref:BREX protein BrxB domain-containing protein n=1 Tax=Propionivibrio sp. TaxID=2212460 RepID=UPI003BEF610D